jgi:hypothetical protein
MSDIDLSGLPPDVAELAERGLRAMAANDVHLIEMQAFRRNVAPSDDDKINTGWLLGTPEATPVKLYSICCMAEASLAQLQTDPFIKIIYKVSPGAVVDGPLGRGPFPTTTQWVPAKAFLVDKRWDAFTPAALSDAWPGSDSVALIPPAIFQALDRGLCWQFTEVPHYWLNYVGARFARHSLTPDEKPPRPPPPQESEPAVRVQWVPQREKRPRQPSSPYAPLKLHRSERSFYEDSKPPTTFAIRQWEQYEVLFYPPNVVTASCFSSIHVNSRISRCLPNFFAWRNANLLLFLVFLWFLDDSHRSTMIPLVVLYSRTQFSMGPGHPVLSCWYSATVRHKAFAEQHIIIPCGRQMISKPNLPSLSGSVQRQLAALFSGYTG